MRVDYAINEGGGERVELGGRAFYLCAAAEKMSSPFRIIVHGRSGHASMPGIADNALVKAAPLIEKLAAYVPEATIGPEVAGFLDVVLGERPPAGQVLERLRALDPLAAETIEPLLAFTLSPTMIAASERRNVIPGTVELTVDRRLLPGQMPEDVDPIVRSVLGEDGVLRAGDDRALRRDALAARHAALAARSPAGSRRPSRARSSHRSAAPASPTRTGSARRSGRSRTASSR